MVEIERGVHLLAEPRARIVGDPRVLLLEHDLELGPHHVVGQHQAGHAVGFELHHRLELVARDALEIAGIVGRGERVLLAADGGDDLREAAGRVLGGALEHQMFEEMREAGFARGLVGGADPVPQHVGHHRRPMVGNHHDLEAVGKHEMGDARSAVGRDRRGERHHEGDGGEGSDDAFGHEFALVELLVAPTIHVQAAECEGQPVPIRPKRD